MARGIDSAAADARHDDMRSIPTRQGSTVRRVRYGRIQPRGDPLAVTVFSVRLAQPLADVACIPVLLWAGRRGRLLDCGPPGRSPHCTSGGWLLAFAVLSRRQSRGGVLGPAGCSPKRLGDRSGRQAGTPALSRTGARVHPVVGRLWLHAGEASTFGPGGIGHAARGVRGAGLSLSASPHGSAWWSTVSRPRRTSTS